MRLCALGLPSLPSFWNSNDCLEPTAKETLRVVERNILVATEEWMDRNDPSMTAIGQSGLWIAGLQPVLVYRRGCATGHTESEGRKEGRNAWGWQAAPEEFLLPLSTSPPPALAAVCPGLVPRQHVPALLGLHPCLPCGDGTCSGEVAAVSTCDNAEYPV